MTFVLTSCNRPRYLDQTLASIADKDLSAINDFVIIEDSTSTEILPIVEKHLRGLPYTFIQNDKTIGQIASIDLAYQKVSTRYIFHCEDDWVFPTSLFIKESREILVSREKIFSVLLRARTETPHLRKQAKPEIVCGHNIMLNMPKKTYRHGSLSFNPGLRRKKDYEAFAPYRKLGPEGVLSLRYKLNGFVLAHLDIGDVRHIGIEPTLKMDEMRYKMSPEYRVRSFRDRIEYLEFFFMR